MSSGETVHLRQLTWLCYLGMVCIAFSYNHFPIILTRVMDTFHLTAAEGGQAGSAIFFGSIVAVVVMTPFSSKFGAKPTCLVACAICGIGCVFEFAAQSYLVLCFGLLLQGIGAGALDLMMSPLIASMYHDNVTSEMLYLHSCFSVGSVVTTIISTGVVTMTNSTTAWRVVPVIDFAVPLVLFIGFRTQFFPNLVAEEHGGDEGEESVESLGTSPSFWVCNLMIFLAGATEYGPIMWLPAFAQDGLGYGDPIPGLLLTGFSITMSIGRITGGRIAANYDPLYLLFRASWFQVVLVLVTALVPFRILSLVTGSFIGLAISILWPTVLAFAAIQHPSGGAKMYGSFTIFGSLGSAAIAWIVGVVKDSTGSLRVAFAATAIAGVTLSTAVLLAKLVARRRRIADGLAAAKKADLERRVGCGVLLCETPRSCEVLAELPPWSELEK